MKKLLLLLLLCPLFLLAQDEEEETPATAATPNFSWYQLSLTAQNLFQKGKYSESVVYARTALLVAQRDSGESKSCYGTCMQNLGVMLQHAGQLQEAVPYLEGSVEHTARYFGEKHEKYAVFLSSLGMLYRELGNLSKALSTLQKAADKIPEIEAFDENYTILILNNLALVSEESGLWDQARRLYKESMDIVARTEGTESTRYATRLNNLAALNMRMHRAEEGLVLYRQAYDIYLAKLGPVHNLTFTGRSNMLRAYLLVARPEEARTGYLELLPRIEKEYGKNHRSYLTAANYLGQAHNLLNEPDKALEILLPTMEAWERYYPGRLQQVRECAFQIAKAYEQKGRLPEMTHWLLRTFSATRQDIYQQLTQLGETEQLATFSANMLNDFWQMSVTSTRYPDNPQLSGAIFDLQMALKGLILSNTQNLRRALFESRDTTLQPVFLEWKNLNKSIAQQYALVPERRVAGFDSLLQRAVVLEGVLVQQLAGFRETTRSVSWKEVQTRLKPGEAVLEFSHFVEKDPARKKSPRALYAAWLLRPGDVSPKQVLRFEGTQLGSMKGLRDLYRPGGLLQNLLWQPVESELAAQSAAGREKVHTLYLSCSGLLHQINFGAIPVRPDGTTLADQVQLHLLGSARQLVQTEETPSLHQKNALVIGGVRYDADSTSLAPSNSLVMNTRSRNFRQYAPIDSIAGNGDFEEEWEYLPWTLREADKVSVALRKKGVQVQMLQGADASEGAFKKRTENVSVLHVATHGYFFPEPDSNATNGFQATADPLIRSGLLLAGANRVWKGRAPLQGQEDGVLTAYEVAQMDLQQVDLVVLSACETGRGDLNNVEGVYGLQRAFKMAGVRYVLMSLWQVDDQSTQEFMDAFYTNWLQQKMTIPEACRQAQHDLQQRYAEPFSPLMWAGFILLE